MKKSIGLLMAVALVVLTAFPAFAATPSSTSTEETTEYEMVLQKSREYKMRRSNVSGSEDPLVEYKRAFDERVKLPEQTLREYGFDEEQVQLMKRYANGELTFEQVALRASASCSTTLSSTLHTSSKYIIKYSFNWSAIPTGLGQDGFGVGAYGIDSSSVAFDTSISSTNASINYCYHNGQLYKTEGAKKTSDTNYMYATFESYKQNDVGSDWVWAKSGTMTMTIVPTVPGGKTFAAVRARGQYGHTSKSASKLSVSLSVSPSSGKISISFAIKSGGGSVTTYGLKQKVFYNDGSDHTES